MPRTKKTKPANPPVIQMFRPMKPEVLLEVAQRFEKDRDSVTVSDLNSGRFTPEEYKALFEKGQVPALYQPALIEMARHLGCSFAVIGQEGKRKREPSYWPAHLGTWKPGRHICEYRVMHEDDLRRNVIEPEKNLIQAGPWCLVVGDSDYPAIFNMGASVGDNSYAHGVAAVKSLNLKGHAKLNNLFIRLNTKASKIAMTGDKNGGAELVCLAHTVGTPGYVTRDGKRLNADQVRSAFKMTGEGDDAKLADPDAVKALKWEPLAEPIVGDGCTKNQAVARVKQTLDSNRTVREGEKATALDRYSKRKSGSPKKRSLEDRIATNMTTIQRSSPQVAFCFGLRHALAGTGTFFADWNSQGEPIYNVVVGTRCGDELTAAAREKIRAAAAASKPAKAGKPAAKPAAAKPGKKAKPSKAKAKPGKKAKPSKGGKGKAIAGEPAAPVKDTSDEKAPAATATTEPAAAPTA